MKSIIFQDKYGVDPSTLTLEEINKIISPNKKFKVVENVGGIFPIKDYDIDKMFDKTLREL